MEKITHDVAAAITGNSVGTPTSSLSEPDYKASTSNTTVANIDKDSNQDIC